MNVPGHLRACQSILVMPGPPNKAWEHQVNLGNPQSQSDFCDVVDVVKGRVQLKGLTNPINKPVNQITTSGYLGIRRDMGMGNTVYIQKQVRTGTGSRLPYPRNTVPLTAGLQV
jgi:hypothetical protein